MIAAARAEIDATYAELAAASKDATQELAQIEAKFVVTTINEEMGSQLVRTPRLTVTDPEIGGHAVPDWWAAQAADTSAKVVATVRAGMTAGEDVEQLVARLLAPTSPFTAALNNAESLVHSGAQRTAMDARNAVLKANSAVVFGLEIVATLDSGTCAQCLAYDGSTYDVDGTPMGATTLPFNGGAPFHFGCRCATVPIMRHYSEVGLEENSMDGKPSSGLSAEKWLDGKSKTEQDEILGVGRAALYRAGKITLRDLVSRTGKQISLGKLNDIYT